MDNIINKMKYELGDLKYQLMVSKEENNQIKDRIKNLNKQNQALQDLNIQINEQAIKNKPDNNANSKMVFKLEKKVSELLEQNEEYKKLCNNAVSIDVYENLQKRFDKLLNANSSQEKTIKRLYNDAYQLEGCRYVFSDIPNNEEGNKFVEQMKSYFNYDSYDFRKRGQYLDNDKLSIGETWKTYSDGQPLSKSKCIRIYIDKKKEGK